MTLIRGVIFDIDGTLVDSNDQHAKAWVEALAEFGIDVKFEQARRLIGKGGDKVLPELSGIEKESDDGKKISDYRAELFKVKYQPHLKPFPGSKDLLALLVERGKRLVVASSAQAEELKVLLKIAGADEFIEDATSSSDAERSKPDPDIVQVALDNLGLDRDEVVMIGDTPYDIEAAARAGIRTIAFRSGGWPDAGLEGALAIYDGPADLRARFDSSPLAEGASSEGRPLDTGGTPPI
jgi:HAD superfamily hydrolase (TIGR01509 family)